jgi:hypothetical protein
MGKFRYCVSVEHRVNIMATSHTMGMWLVNKTTYFRLIMFVCLFSRRYNPLWLYFHSPVAGFSLLVFEVSWSHKDAPQSVGLLWTSDQSVAETSTWQHTTLTTDKHPCPPVGFEPTVSAGERPKTYALDRATPGTGLSSHNIKMIKPKKEGTGRQHK